MHTEIIPPISPIYNETQEHNNILYVETHLQWNEVRHPHHINIFVSYNPPFCVRRPCIYAHAYTSDK